MPGSMSRASPTMPIRYGIPSTAAQREPLERVDRVWRGLVMDTYALEKLTGWTPELSPPPDSPLFRWRVLAGDFRSTLHVAVEVG